MNLGEYLAKESINSEIDDFAKHAKRILPKNCKAELENITNRVYSGSEQVSTIYEFKARHGLFPLFWRANRPRLTKGIPFVVKNCIKGSRKVLDVGCSDGLKTVYYAIVCPETKIIGIDHCKSPILLAKDRAKKYNLRNVEFIHADLNKPCFKESSFDSIIATYVLNETYYMAYGLGHSSGMEAVYKFDSQLKELARILAPEGRLAISLGVFEESVKYIENQIKYAAEKADLKEEKFQHYVFKNGRTDNILNFVYQKPE